MIIKEKIKRNFEDINIKININSTNNIYGEDQDINNYINKLSEDLINPINDGDVRFFNLSNNNLEFKPLFYSLEKEEYGSNFSYAGFNDFEIVNYSLNLRNSFFIFEYFNDFRKKVRKKIFTNYYSKLWKLGLDDFSYQNPIINNTPELINLLIPVDYINKQTNNFILYYRIFFYNAKTGRIKLFYNDDIGINKEDGLFFKISINKNNNTWYSYNSPINAKEFIKNDDYINLLNDNNETFDNIKPTYPNSQEFNLDGTYGNGGD